MHFLGIEFQLLTAESNIYFLFLNHFFRICFSISRKKNYFWFHDFFFISGCLKRLSSTSMHSWISSHCHLFWVFMYHTWLQDGGSNFWPFLGPISMYILFWIMHPCVIIQKRKEYIQNLNQLFIIFKSCFLKKCYLYFPFIGFSIPYLVSLMDLTKKLEYFGDLWWDTWT